MKITIDISTENASFWTEEGTFDPSELQRVMDKVTNEALRTTMCCRPGKDGGVNFEPTYGVCRDINGNDIGSWNIDP